MWGKLRLENLTYLIHISNKESETGLGLEQTPPAPNADIANLVLIL